MIVQPKTLVGWHRKGVQTFLATEVQNGEATACREDRSADQADGERESNLRTGAGGGGTFLEAGYFRVAPDCARVGDGSSDGRTL